MRVVEENSRTIGSAHRKQSSNRKEVSEVAGSSPVCSPLPQVQFLNLRKRRRYVSQYAKSSYSNDFK